MWGSGFRWPQVLPETGENRGSSKWSGARALIAGRPGTVIGRFVPGPEYVTRSFPCRQWNGSANLVAHPSLDFEEPDGLVPARPEEREAGEAGDAAVPRSFRTGTGVCRCLEAREWLAKLVPPSHG
ncbi:hypothetical protein GCM10010228_51660 [Streptomyces massasporeus]|nr:hypothetical protein GCM10010228_51660 [Streptomyces massasporeus]